MFGVQETSDKGSNLWPVQVLKCDSEVQVFTSWELNRILEAASPGLEKAFLSTAIHTGLRAAELTGLLWSAVDLKESTLKVERSLIELSKKNGGAFLGPPKNQNAYRIVPLPPETVMELRRWKLQCPPTPEGYVWVNALGQAMKKITGNYILKNCCRRAGVKHLSLKCLRHTFASQYISLGTSASEVSKMMGHYSPAFTLSTYTHWTNEKTTSQVKLADLIKKAAGPS
jgi:integrase